MFARSAVALFSIPLLLHAANPEKPIVRYTPMEAAPRSIYVPLNDTLHLAFDTALLRIHTAWFGDGITVNGTPHRSSKTPFTSQIRGTPYSTSLPVVPWTVGERPELFQTGTDQIQFDGMEDYEGGISFRFRIGVGSDSEIPVVQSIVKLNHLSIGHGTTLEIGPSKEKIWHVVHYAPAGAQVTQVGEKLRLKDESFNGDFWYTADASIDVKWHHDLVDGNLTVRRNEANGGASDLVVEEISNPYMVVLLEIPPHAETISIRLVNALHSVYSSLSPYDTRIDLALAELQEFNVHTIRKTDPERNSVSEMKIRPPRGDDYYSIESFPLPPEVELKATGMDWLPNGDLAVCTWPGEVWIVENHTGAVSDTTYRLFAEGLNEPLGLAVVEGEIVVAQKPELTRVRDTNGDGVADTFETISNDWGYTGNYHAFAFGPAVDTKGNFYVAFCGQRGRQDVKYASWMIKISPDGKTTEGFASGLRAPNGFGFYGPDNDLFVADNQGNWVGACKLNHVQQGQTYGFAAATPAPNEWWKNPPDDFAPPAVWFPRKLAPSAAGFATIPDQGFGPFGGQMIIADFQNSVALRVHLEQVNGEWQGAVFPFMKGFESGANRVAFDPKGRLYIGGVKNKAWSALGPFEQSLERVSWKGETPFSVKAVRAKPDGFELVFTKPQLEEFANDPESYFVSQFNYRHHQTYGSPEFDHDGQPGSATEIKIESAELSKSGLSVRLYLNGLQPGYVTRFLIPDLESTDGDLLWHDEFFYTLNTIPER